MKAIKEETGSGIMKESTDVSQNKNDNTSFNFITAFRKF